VDVSTSAKGRPLIADNSNAARAPWRAKVLTLHPELFPGPLAASLAGQALRSGLWSLEATDLRAFGVGRHRAVDDRPAGGGAGMVLRADVVARAVDATRAHAPELPLIVFTPRGEALTQAIVRELANGPGAVLVAGRFEGIDQRVVEARQGREISIGDYVLAGGELPAMVLMEAAVRLLPGVVGEAASLSEESFELGLLEYPQFTRPRDWEGLPIPSVLLSGNHAEIAAWRRAEAERITRERRPDMWVRRRRGPSEL
jgi:tRNA (guanine37-N1)-methyltransferase